ncbi:hypothetical protein AB0906_14570, partial [Streptomyces bauhiniae]
MAPGLGPRLGRRIGASHDPYLCARLGLACALATGAVLLFSGVSDEGPPQPRPPQAGSTAVDPARGAVSALPPAEPVPPLARSGTAAASPSANTPSCPGTVISGVTAS